MGPVLFTENCVGCRTCEIACSYYHRRIFSRKDATSIEIRRDEKNGKFGIILYRQPEGGHLACNCTEGNEFCVNYCPIIARNELKSILTGKTNGK